MTAIEIAAGATSSAPAGPPAELSMGEPFGPDRLARHARRLARRQKVVIDDPRARRTVRGPGLLLARLESTERVLHESRDTLAGAAASGMPVSPAGEWLLDNYYVIAEQITEIRTTLPAGYYHQLPKLAPGSTLAGYPRIYEIAFELIAHTEGRLSVTNLALVVQQYQRITPLTIGELWAVPAMLRIGFLEHIRDMGVRAAHDTRDMVNATTWAGTLLDAEDVSPDALKAKLDDLVHHTPTITPAFLTRFLQQVRSRRADFTPLLWIEQWIAEDVMSVEEAVQRSTQRLALTQLVIANCVASLRAITNIDWRTFVEGASVTEAILRTDPAMVYTTMTFATRDRYRHAVEHLASETRRAEEEVASAAIAAAKAQLHAGTEAGPEAHVGYYLVDRGRAALEATLGFVPRWRERLLRRVQAAPSTAYLGTIALAMGILAALLLRPVHDWAAWTSIVALLLVLPPAVDAAVVVANQLVNLFIPPARLPRLDYETGVPRDCRTMVVVPILLGSADAVEDALDHLEAQYLANRDVEIRFALLGDFVDAAEATVDGDEAITSAAIAGVAALNATYARAANPALPFYFFHRPRRWNEAEGRWMGWERKRGKLADWNAFLLGAARDAFSVTEGELAWLTSVRYVITLDSDTVLPPDAAVALIGTMAHPLNCPRFDDVTGRVTAGYGIMQPRVGVSLASANTSRFAAIFAGHPGVDPYTTAVSDVYQDLYHEGTYTGKGIYDVAMFEHATAGRFPENSLLSHDLIEGSFARAALVTDVVLFDDYPTRYLTSTRRQHRWVRGDWQLLPWLDKAVPGRHGETPNPLSALSRWKIFDNLRRSLTPMMSLAWIVAAWTVLPNAGTGWMTAIAVGLTLPWTAPLLVAACRPPRNETWRPYYAALLGDAQSSALQILIALVMLPHQAFVAADAIVRTLGRVYGSRRNMLQWQTASQVERASRSGRGPAWIRMRSSVVLAALLLLPMWWMSATRATSADGWLFLGLLSACWLLAPEVAVALSAPRVRPELELSAADRAISERYAREHWGYFETFATEATHWLIPDNVQETPEQVIALRTSPTNIGLQLLATMSARDLGLIDTTGMLDRLERTLDTVDTLPKVRGHLMNWYDVRDLRVLEPAYLSAVDSGNLAGHLIALAAGCAEQRDARAAEQPRLARLAERARAIAMAMDFTLFYDARRRLMSIGYDARSGQLDASAYDLLASEARLGSFVAVAKGDVPAEHWFHLGRTLTTADGATALVSWSGSMFEYLMPLLVMPSRPFSLLDQTHHASVRRQIAYATKRGVPWGMSESAYNLRDRHETYQYRAFGVSNLGLKRGLVDDLVIAPYASALALAVAPHDALRNLQELERRGAVSRYGFYDAVDYTRAEPDGTGAVVRTHMAHHVGMSLVALTNALTIEAGEGIWPRRFMTDPAVRAVALLLDERVPRSYATQPAQAEQASPRTRPARVRSVTREYDDAATSEPHTGVIGGQDYSVLLTNAGAGYSRAAGMDVYRWRADATKDETGQWIYLRDCTTGAVWSAAHQPVRAPATAYQASFASDRIVFTRTDGDVQTRTEVVVVPRERAEIRRVILTNTSRVAREVELTSYAEVVLTDPGADRAHPAFQNLFVETEWAPKLGAVLASRRPRSADEHRPWCVHVVATGSEALGDVTCETDRARFLGRGRTVHEPRAMDATGALSCTAGGVLDPIVSLRVRVRLEPGRSVTVAFTTVVADDRERALQAADRYRDLNASRRALSLSGTEAQIELRDLDVLPDDAALYQDLASALIYPRESLRAPRADREANRRGQSALWAHGISGDWPIVLATIKDSVGLPSVRQLLVAHKYWRMKGVRCDLVILNAKAPSYVQDLQDQLTTMVVASGEGGLLETPGGVFVRRADVLDQADVLLLRATAAIHVICDGVGLGAIAAAEVLPRREVLAVAPRSAEPVSTASNAAVPSSVEGNGYGALTPAHDYAIEVNGAHLPPAPWANVVANPNAGFCVTERGGGFAWTDSSFFFRLTPWFNDPVSDPCGEVLYLRDVSTGRWWTPTPGPRPAVAGRDAAYRVVHAPGQSTFIHAHGGITSELAMSVPLADPVKISTLRLSNAGTEPRTIEITSYVELVLGTQREATRHQLHTRRDEGTGAIFAQNLFMQDFASRVAFSWISEPVRSWSASRASFIGRNGTLDRPAALAAVQLDGAIGAGDDPCAALRCTVTLAPGETRVVVVLLGAATSDDEARAIIARCGAPDLALAATERSVARWNERLGTISVKSPSPAFDALVNRWSLYQALSCRMWARSALYQSSGAFGFRDQLQDGMAFVYADPDVTRAHLLHAASRQFVEGDVQHWWHEPSGRGVRTRFSDDLAWLPFCADQYVSVTGDVGVWDEVTPYLDMRVLAPHEHEVYDLPVRSERSDTLFVHCRRALERACTIGAHGLPLMGGGDWNDGMNRVGMEGRGESVWLAWFLIATLRRFATHADQRTDAATATWCRERADAYAAAVEREAWDGAWYRRAYFDDGTPLGSAASQECQIDAIAQSWSVISEAGDRARARTAMQSVGERLVREEDRILLLLTPPFDTTPHDPGYIKGYLPGVRENGAQYTHAALWTVLATIGLRDGDRAAALFDLLNPLTHATTAADAERYKVEPYVIAADVYSAPGHVGRGGWTWYTGSASWSYRVALEGILGFTKRGDRLSFLPCMPGEWTEVTIDYRHGTSSYRITLRQDSAMRAGEQTIDVDGIRRNEPFVQLGDDGLTHVIEVRSGPLSPEVVAGVTPAS